MHKMGSHDRFIGVVGLMRPSYARTSTVTLSPGFARGSLAREARMRTVSITVELWKPDGDHDATPQAPETTSTVKRAPHVRTDTILVDLLMITSPRGARGSAETADRR